MAKWIKEGESKASIIKKSLENDKDVKFPATVLQNLKNSRFYITKGASKTLNDVMSQYWAKHVWDNEKKQRALLKFAKEKNIFGKKINISDLDNDPIFKQIQ